MMTVPAQPRKFYSLRKGEIQENGFGPANDAQRNFYEIQRYAKDDQTRYKLWQYNKDEFDRTFSDEGRFYSIERKDQRVQRIDNPDYKLYTISKPPGWKPPPEPIKKKELDQRQPRLYAIQRADKPKELSERIVEYRRQSPMMQEPPTQFRPVSPNREPIIRIMTPPKRIATPPRRVPTPRLLSPIFTRKPSPPIYIKPPSPIIPNYRERPLMSPTREPYRERIYSPRLNPLGYRPPLDFGPSIRRTSPLPPPAASSYLRAPPSTNIYTPSSLHTVDSINKSMKYYRF